MGHFDISKKTLKDLYHKDNLSTYEIGRRFGVSATTIQTKLKELGINVKSTSDRQVGRHGPVRDKDKWTSYDKQVLIKLRDANFSVSDISTIMSRSKSMIKRVITQMESKYASKK